MNKPSSTHKHIKQLREQDKEWNDIINIISEEWDMSLYRANIIVEFYKEMNK